MASAAPDSVRGVVDTSGRLTSADLRLAQLQEAAGGRVGSRLAVPQLAELARLAGQLGISLSRPAFAATDHADLDLWVRVEPSSEGVQLAIESWVERPVQTRRWSAVVSGETRPHVSAADLTTDAELRILNLVPATAHLLGTTAADAIGQPVTRLLDLQPGADGAMPLLTAVAQRRSFVEQTAVARATGTTLQLSGKPRLASNGSFAGLQCSVADPDNLGDDATVDSFGTLLREPLDVIVGEAERIADRAEGPLRSDYAAYASDIASAAKHLLDVLQAMGREVAADEQPQQIDLAELAFEAAGLVQAQANDDDVTLELDGSASLPASGQPRQVTQILVNLIGNAIRHSPTGGVVRVTASFGMQASITVADQGPGVAPDDAERIFERFEQVEPHGVGAGLGLAISRRLAQQMGGDIGLESKAGEGARFTLTLPLA